jgi:hypothetical protein
MTFYNDRIIAGINIIRDDNVGIDFKRFEMTSNLPKQVLDTNFYKGYFDLNRLKGYHGSLESLYNLIFRIDVEFVSAMKLSLHSFDGELLEGSESSTEQTHMLRFEMLRKFEREMF